MVDQTKLSITVGDNRYKVNKLLSLERTSQVHAQKTSLSNQQML